MEHIEPKMSVDASGNITWVSTLVDYDPSLFFRGKKVTDEEFNTLFLQQAYQGNYTANSLSAFLEKHLKPTIHRTFTSTFNLLPSYVKTFTSVDWGNIQEDGYYYITISPEEHGFQPDENISELDRMNIDTEMYLMDSEGQFFEVNQIETTKDNTVTLYTDDNTLFGFVVIRTNDKAYALASTSIDATQVDGLHPVATSGKYADLVDINSPTGPNTRIQQLASDILGIVQGDTPVYYAETAAKAESASALLLDGTIQGIPVSNIFEEGSNYVKNATIADYASADTSKGTIEERLTNLGFKKGSITLEDDRYVTLNELKRQGNYVIGNIDFDNTDVWVFTYSQNQGGTYKESKLFGKIEDPAFLPKEDVTFGVATRVYSSIFATSIDPIHTTVKLYCTIKTTGEVIMDCQGSTEYGDNFNYIVQVYTEKINFGYEANPINKE